MMIKDKVAIVTGSSRGIGRAIADAFAAQGAKVVVCSTQQKSADAVAKKLTQSYGTEAMGFAMDVSKEEDAKALITATMDRWGRVDILVNNAGITRDNLVLRLKAEDWQAVLDTNLNSVFYITKAVLRPMLKQRGGRVINMSSVVGLIGNPGQANYAASKAGIIAFTKSVAREYGGKGILANVIAPGFVETDMTSALPKEYLDNIINNIPLKRLARSEDIADVALFLASDLSKYLTGQVISVDGGMS